MGEHATEKRKVMIFDDWKSIIHYIFGFVSSFNVVWLIFASAIFLAYQLTESRDFVELVGDCIEFLIGVVCGLLVHNVINIAFNSNSLQRFTPIKNAVLSLLK
jgi:hypothetical protein